MAAERSAQRYGLLRLPHGPAGPPFPEEIHLRKVCGIVWCVDASDEEAEKAMAPMLAVAEPLMHGVGRMPLRDLNAAFDGLYSPGDQWYWRGDFFNELADDAIVRNREWNDRTPTWKCGSHLYPVDGAARDVGRGHRIAYRDATWSQVIIAVDPDPAGAERHPRLGDRILGGPASLLGRRCVRQLHDG